MFRKILIAFVLLIVLAGLSYVKTTFDHAKQDETYEKAKEDVKGEIQVDVKSYENSIDSLGTVLASKEESFTNSLTNQKQNYDTQLDSLENIIDSQSEKINKLSKRPTETAQTTTKKITKPKQLSQHEKVYRYYKKRYADLPSDLSDYEQKIALSEIREETASKFSITLTQLSKIRKEYKLSY